MQARTGMEFQTEIRSTQINGIFDNGRSKVAYLEPEDTDGHLIELVEPASD